MTLLAFLRALSAAVRLTDARLMTGPAYAPKGGYLRFLLPPNAAVRHPSIPPVVDPIGLVWAAQEKQLVCPLESVRIGQALGLSLEDIALIILLADGRVSEDRRACRVATVYGDIIRAIPKDVHLPHLK